MKKFILFIYLLQSLTTLGQPDTLYLTSDYGITNDFEKATYLRIIKSKNVDGTTMVIDLLRTGEKIFEGSVVYLNSDLQVNDYVFFYKNGQTKYEGEIDNITEKGFKGFTERTYFPSGQLRSEQSTQSGKEKFLKAFDSEGHPTLINGNGVATLEVFYYNQLWSGKIKDYERDSIWTAIDTRTEKLVHIEAYSHGKFQTGKTLTKNGFVNYQIISPSIPTKLINKIKKEVKREINNQVDKSERKREYKVGLLFENGKPTKIRHLIKNINDKVIDLDNIQLPTDYIYLERGLPVERMTIGIKV